MKHTELKDKLLSNEAQRIVLCSKFGAGKTTYLKYICKEAIKENIIPLYIDCYELLNLKNADTELPDTLFKYIIDKYSGDLSINDGESDLLLKKCLEKCFNNDSFHYLVIIDEVQFLDELDKNSVLTEIMGLNKYKSVSIVYSTHLDEDTQKKPFEKYEIIRGFGIIDEEKIVKVLNNHSVIFDEIDPSWLELLNTPYFLYKFIDFYDPSKNDLSKKAITKAEIIQSYIKRYYANAEIKNRYDYERFIFTFLPKYTFDSSINKISIPNNDNNAELIESLFFLNTIAFDRACDEIICSFSHPLYYCYFEALYISNALKSEKIDIAESVSNLKTKLFDRETNELIGNQIGLSVSNCKESKILSCLDYIRKDSNLHFANGDSDLIKLIFEVEKKDSEYKIAVKNCIDIIINSCEYSLSGLDLSWLDLSLCSFSGINCKNTDFSHSKLKDSCFINDYVVQNPTSFAVSKDNSFVVLAETLSNMNEYCYINIYNMEISELNNSFCLENIISLFDIDGECFAVLRYEDSDINLVITDIYQYNNGVYKSSLKCDATNRSFKSVGVYKEELFYFLDRVLYSVNLTTHMVTEYAEFPLNKYDSIKITTDQHNKNNNAIILYNDSEVLELFYIGLECLLSKEFDKAYNVTIEKSSMNDKVFFSEKEPVVAIKSTARIYIYNYKTIENTPSDPDDYVIPSSIVCKNSIVSLGEPFSRTNPKALDDSEGELITCQKGIAVFRTKKNFCFYDIDKGLKKYLHIPNQSNYHWEKIDDNIVAIYSDGFISTRQNSKRYLYNIDSCTFECEHKSRHPQYVDFIVYGTEETSSRELIDEPFLRHYFAFHNCEKSTHIDSNNKQFLWSSKSNDELYPYYEETEFTFYDLLCSNKFVMPSFAHQLNLRYRKVKNSETKFAFCTHYSMAQKFIGKEENDVTEQIIIYDFSDDRILVRFDIPEEVFANNDPLLGNFLFQGEFLCVEHNYGYCIKIRNFEYKIDIDGNIIDRHVIEIVDYDKSFLLFYDSYKPIIATFIFKQFFISNFKSTPEIVIKLNEFILKYGVNKSILSFPDTQKYIKYIASIMYSARHWSKPLVTYVFANLTKLVFISNDEKLIYQKENSHHLLSYGIMLIAFYAYEWGTALSPNNYLKIIDLTPSSKSFIINDPIYDLDVSNADFSNVQGLSYDVLKMLAKYGGII